MYLGNLHPEKIIPGYFTDKLGFSNCWKFKAINFFPIHPLSCSIFFLITVFLENNFSQNKYTFETLSSIFIIKHFFRVGAVYYFNY